MTDDRTQKQIEYSIALQRCIETLCRAIEGDASAALAGTVAADAPHHAKMVNAALASLRDARQDGARRLELVERMKEAWDEMWGGDALGVLMDDIDAEVERSSVASSGTPGEQQP